MALGTGLIFVRDPASNKFSVSQMQRKVNGRDELTAGGVANEKCRWSAV
jgi:hypothetical protein